MIYLGIDPGTTESAMVLIDELGRILHKGKFDNQRCLDLVESYACLQTEPIYLCIEMISGYGLRVGTEVFETCVWIGRFFQAWYYLGDPGNNPVTVKRYVIKKHFGVFKGKDKGVRAKMIQLFGKPGSKLHPGPTYGVTDDMWAALSVAAYAKDHSKELFGANA